MIVAPITPLPAGVGIAPAGASLPAPPTGSFASLLMNGIGAADAKVTAADEAVRAFALDDAVPLHQVTYALEQARLSMELMLQVRSRLLEGYQQLMNMQL